LFLASRIRLFAIAFKHREQLIDRLVARPFAQTSFSQSAFGTIFPGRTSSSETAGLTKFGFFFRGKIHLENLTEPILLSSLSFSKPLSSGLLTILNMLHTTGDTIVDLTLSMFPFDCLGKNLTASPVKLDYGPRKIRRLRIQVSMGDSG
jgi:hypothetical protein